ncbi:MULTISPECIES: hypothetical protein [unclassified Streptomyces]|uniref:hypothetical protein n=1 Tax=unclassified Streptomyces TaxID=2593676 RepID=UPI003719EE03
MTEHTALTHKVQELNTENRSLWDRLTAALDSSRFADRRISELAAELIEVKGMVRQRQTQRLGGAGVAGSPAAA